MTEFIKDHIYGKSEKIDESSSKLIGDFDLFIFFTTDIDSKITEMINLCLKDLSFTYSMLICFKSLGIENFSTESNNSLKHLINEKVEKNKFFYIEDENNNLDQIIKNINFTIRTIIMEMKRPLNIGIDINSCPNYLIIYLLRLILQNSLSTNISFFYSKEFQDSSKHICFNETWKLIDMSGQCDGYDIEKRQMYFISLGYEETNYRSIINEYDSEGMKILLPEDNLNFGKITKIKEEFNYSFDYDVSEKDNIIFAPSDDAIATWKEITNLSTNDEYYNQVFVVSGLKPHALAIGIYGYLNRKIIIAYLMDEPSNLKTNSFPTFWRYNIKDLSLI